MGAMIRCDCFAKLEERWKAGRFACVGLDSDLGKLPLSVTREHESAEDALFVFNRAIIDATAGFSCAFKPNSAFYEAEGEAGYRALKRTAAYLKDEYPDIPVILDAKRADIGNTNEAYARGIFDDLLMDAVTVHPYLGAEALRPFLDRKDKGIFVLVKTSNPGSGEFQDLPVGGLSAQAGEKLYEKVARQVAGSWNGNGNCGAVVGATYPAELAAARAILGEMPILVPGVGKQGGSAAEAVAAGRAKGSPGLVISSSRGILYASSGEDFAEAAGREAQALSREIEAALSTRPEGIEG